MRHVDDQGAEYFSGLYRRMQEKLGVESLRSDADAAALVEARLPVEVLASLARHGLADDEIHALVLPRRTLAHRRAKGQPLTREESDRALRLARVISLAEEVFSDEAKALRWLRRPKRRFEGQAPIGMLATEASGRRVEEMLYQIDDGMAA